MRLGRTPAFVLLVLLVGGVASQLPSAMADDSGNPLSALWDAIFDLQSRDDALQAQIDELRAERNAFLVQAGEPALASNLYASIDVEAAEDGRTLVHVTAGNSGPDRAAGVKLTTFYLMPLFEINSIDGSLCEDKSRGIIECIVGTLEEGQEYAVTIDATARESRMANTWTVDVSTTTDDSDYSDNHVTYDFETGSGERIEIPQVEQPEEPTEEEPATEQEEPEQDGSEPTDSTEAEEPQENTGNQTTAEPEAPVENQTSSETVAEDAGSNGTSAEAEESDSSGNQTSAEPEETVESDSSGNATESESAEQPEETQEEQPAESEERVEESGDSEEESTADEAQEEGSEESEGAGEEQESAPEEDASESEESEGSGESGEENPPQ